MSPSDVRSESGTGTSVMDLLNSAVAIASKRVRTKATAINNVLEVLESEPRGDDAVALTVAYVLRQAGRGVLDRELAKELAGRLLKILETEADPAAQREMARKLVGLVKWIFETAEGFRFDLSRVTDFRDLVQTLRGR